MANWRDTDRVLVGWIGKPELGTLLCDVVTRDRTNDEPHGVSAVRWASGAVQKVAFCHSEGRYVYTSQS